MADHGTAIEWTQAPGFKGETWNPVTGCDRVSPGCAHCYALDLAARLKGMGQKRYQRDGDPKTSGPGFGLTLHPDKLEEPSRWRKPRMVFVNSMSDLFHEEIPDEYIAQVFEVMAQARQHVFQILTKRPERMRDLLNDWWGGHAAKFDALPPDHSGGYVGATSTSPAAGWARDRARNGIPNIWLGVSIENRRFVDRADLLRQTPAAVRFISAEPLLGPLLPDSEWATDFEHERYPYWDAPAYAWREWADEYQGPGLNLEEIDWLIVGGESGASHRAIDADWVRALRDHTQEECWQGERDGTTAFFFKQWGGRTPKAGGRELDGRTWSEWPSALVAVAA
jgi:protein gp37